MEGSVEGGGGGNWTQGVMGSRAVPGPSGSESVASTKRNEDAIKLAEQYRFTELSQAQCEVMIKLSPPPSTHGKPFCNATFDGWGCWLNTPAGTTASIPCTETIFRFHISNISNNATATKKCDENGTWYVNPNTNRPFSNYTACTFVGQSPEDSFIPIYIFVGGCSLSIIMLLVSLAIFMTFSQLRCERITVHKNLFVSYVLTGTVWILFFTLVILDGDVQHRNPVWCQVLQVLTQYCTTCNFAWMLCEGLYLHVIMAHTFRTGNILLRVLFFIGWGSPFILTVIYALVRGTTQKNTTKCWSRADVLQWITFAPVVISIVVNILILINLVRLLVTKLRQVPDAPQSREAGVHTSARACVRACVQRCGGGGGCAHLCMCVKGGGRGGTLKAVRATLILAPLFGVQFLLLPVPPKEDTMLFEVYRYCIAVHTSLQGALVSIMYCFCNGEVTALLKRKWTQHRLMTAHTQKNTALTSLSISEGYTMVQARPDHSASQRSRVGPDTRTSAAPRESVETRPLREM